MRKLNRKNQILMTIVLFAVGVMATVGIGVVLMQNNIAPSSADAASISVTITESCVYKSGVTVSLGSITIKENNVGYGKQCPPSKNNSPLSYKKITRTNPSSSKSISAKFTYWSSGIKTYKIDKLSSAFNLSTPMANASISYYQFK